MTPPACRFDLLTLHPELVRGFFAASILARAVAAGRIAVGVHDLRTWAIGRHKTADDAPYGGGPGMVMRVDVAAAGVRAVRSPECRVLLTSAAGRPFTQADAARLAGYPHVVVLCGHYEGIDARIEGEVDEQVSLGDFVLTGGEIAAAAIVDATARLVPGVLGNALSPVEESFASGLLEFPQYTRPREWEGQLVPEVLASGDHGRVAQWRLEQAIARTKARRPDLWARWSSSRVDEPAGEV